MKHSHGQTTRTDAPTLVTLEIKQSDRGIRRLRILLLALALVEVIAVFMPGISNQWRSEFGFLPQMLLGLVVFALILTLHLAEQRKFLREISADLIAGKSYANRLEEISLIDPPTQLFNRRYLDELFNHQIRWMNPHGKSATLLLIEVLPNEQNEVAEEIVIQAAFILRSNFRGSDYVVRYFPDEFLVVMPDTSEQLAQIALSRLIDKVDHWNRTNERCELALRLALGTCPPGGNLWEKLSEIEERMENNSDAGVRTLRTHKPLKPVEVEGEPLQAKRASAS